MQWEVLGSLLTVNIRNLPSNSMTHARSDASEFGILTPDLIKYHENLEVYAKMDLVNPPSSKSTKPPKEQCLLALLGGQLVYINIQY